MFFMSILKKIIFLLISCLALYKFINPVAAVEVAQKNMESFRFRKIAELAEFIEEHPCHF